uniref:Uncharacterized protein n=1 Tax=Fagus sylvatica TaxID=28930 RepID=A0A2N9J242_FAGSY
MIGRHARGIVSSSFVTHAVMRLVVVLEAPLRGRQIFVFNEVASLRAANATCRHATGRCFRRGVSRFAENGLGPPPIEGFVSPDSVLHRLSAELYSVICPAIHTWEAVRNRMVANETEWPLPLSEELPEGLSDESNGGVTKRSRVRGGPEYFGVSSNGEEDLTVDEFLFCYEPVQIALSRGFWAFKNRDIKTLRSSKGYPRRPTEFGRRTGTSLCAATIGRGCRKKGPNDFVGVRRRGFRWILLIAALDRPLLNSVWQERIFRILDIEDRRYNIFIEPDLLATFSLGPIPSSSVKALLRANKKRVNTMKLNKSRLKQMAQSGEVAAAPISLKRKKPDEGSSKRAEEAPPRPSAQVATPPVFPTAVPSVQRDPPVILVDSDFTPPTAASTINQSPLVAMDRAKGAITTPDMEEYAVAHTEDLSLLMVHSLMRGLTEAMVMARRCASVEEDLAMLRAKSIADEAEMKSTKRAVMELTKERKEAMAEAEKLRTELKARDDDVKAAVDAKDKAVADLKHLVGQIEGAKEAAVSEFRASEAFEDINTRYFLSGFEAFQKTSRPALPRVRFRGASTL